MNELKGGTLAYFDSFCGMVPCKVVSVTGNSGFASTSQDVVLRVTSNGRYRRGEHIHTNGLHAVPRKAYRRSKYGGSIRPYVVTADTEVSS